MVMNKQHVTVPTTVKSKKVTKDPIHYTVHPKYMEVSCNTKLVNVGLDVTLMMLDTSINDDGKITDEQLFISTLDKWLNVVKDHHQVQRVESLTTLMKCWN